RRFTVDYRPVGEQYERSTWPCLTWAAAFLLMLSVRGTAAQVCTGAPSEARGLSLTGTNPTQITWMPPSDPGGTQAVVYDVLRSPVPDGFLSATCVVSGFPGLGVGDANMPTPILFYLVRAKNGCGGTLGTNSAGLPTAGAPCQFGQRERLPLRQRMRRRR